MVANEMGSSRGRKRQAATGDFVAWAMAGTYLQLDFAWTDGLELVFEFFILYVSGQVAHK
jgi:hypothetical protein